MSERSPSDDILESVVKAARDERSARDPVLERIATGEATEDEIRDFEKRAEEDADAARALALHRPLDGHAHDRIANAILRETKGTNQEDATEAERPANDVGADAARGRMRRLFYVLPAIAAAAGVLLFVLFRSKGDIPAYELTVRPAADVRLTPAPATSAASVRLHPSSTLDLVLRPDAPFDGPVAVRAVIVHGGRVNAWDPPVEHSNAGAMRIRAKVDTIVTETSGTWEIVIALARPSALPSSADLGHIATSAEEPAPNPAVRIVRAKVDISPNP